MLTCEILWEPIVAIDFEEHASEMAVRYLLLSAASWALQFFPVGRVFCVSHFTFIAKLNRYAMSPANAALMRSWIVFCIEESEHCLRVDGAHMSMSRWRRSHQKRTVSSMVGQLVLEMTMARMIDAEGCRRLICCKSRGSVAK